MDNIIIINSLPTIKRGDKVLRRQAYQALSIFKQFFFFNECYNNCIKCSVSKKFDTFKGFV